MQIKNVNDEVHRAVLECSGNRKRHKKAQTAGFYYDLVVRVVHSYQKQKAGWAQVASTPLALARLEYNPKASGGFRDVGGHTTAERLPTCWPLVEHVFHFLAQQVWTTATSVLSSLVLHSQLPA